MRNYLLGIATVIIVILGFNAIPALAEIPTYNMNLGFNSYIWLEDTVANDINTSVPYNIEKGDYIIDYTEDGFPVVSKGVKVSFEAKPTAQDLNALDLYLNAKGLKREGGITLVDKVNQLEQQVNALTAAVPK